MPTIMAEHAGRHVCPFRGFESCLGSRCMAWVWVGEPHERTTTDNLVMTPDGPRPSETLLPDMPAGEGWERDGELYLMGYENSAKLKLRKATAQRWIRERAVTRGRCGRCQPDERHDSDLPF